MTRKRKGENKCPLCRKTIGGSRQSMYRHRKTEHPNTVKARPGPVPNPKKRNRGGRKRKVGRRKSRLIMKKCKGSELKSAKKAARKREFIVQEEFQVGTGIPKTASQIESDAK